VRVNGCLWKAEGTILRVAKAEPSK
jgi:hypothetical protein